MNYQTIQAVAEALLKAQSSGQAIDPIKTDIERLAQQEGKAVLEVAYAIQNAVTAQRLQQGSRLVGRKIGLTSKTVQQQLGVDEPDFGSLFAHMSYGCSEAVDISGWIQPKAEAEIALVLERDLTHEHNTFADIISATAYALPAIEIVDSRIRNWEISLYDTVADNASAVAFVLGSRPVKLENVELARCGMIMTCNGEEASVGAGTACLGNPLNAAVWLANKMARLGTPLRAGDIVLTGALGQMVSISAGDALWVEIEGLGQVKTNFVSTTK